MLHVAYPSLLLFPDPRIRAKWCVFHSLPSRRTLWTLVWYYYTISNANQPTLIRTLVIDCIVSASMSLCSLCQSFLRSSLEGRVEKSKQIYPPHLYYLIERPGHVVAQSIRDGCWVCCKLRPQLRQDIIPEKTYKYRLTSQFGWGESFIVNGFVVDEEKGN